MDLKRFFVDNIIGNEVTLTGDEFYHAVKVTRHKIGYSLIVCDNSMYDYYATVTAIENDRLVAQIDKKVVNQTELSQNINLFIGVNKDLDTAVQKAVELGISCVTPFYSQHTAMDKDINIARLQRIVLESSKQCGRAKLMQVNSCINLSDIADKLCGETLFFYEKAEDKKLSDIEINPNSTINIIIGGEGGFADFEATDMISLGAKTLSLGKRVLRVSTAVVSAISLVLQKIGEM